LGDEGIMEATPKARLEGIALWLWFLGPVLVGALRIG